jgi:serine/threonine protein kinase/tetratricopeptide (TPR) repeat protein
MEDSSSQSKLEALFHDALERPSAERLSFIEGACGEDAQLRDQAAALVAAFELESGFLETPVLERGPSVSQMLCAQGEELSHYQILQLIGRGGMGDVYLAKDNTLGRRVALKLFPLRPTVEKAALARFWLEARTASALNHPNIMTVYEIGNDRGLHYIATEYVEGVTVRQLLANGPLPADQICNIALQTATGLMAAHAAGIVHRDIKPENLIVRPDGYVKILDFGLAKLTANAVAIQTGAADSGRDAVTIPGILVGTVGYMSPEQVRGLDPDTRSDLFSLGTLIYEMATGKCPFAGKTVPDALNSILSEEPPFITEVVPSFPADVASLVAKLLQKDQKNRCQSAGELIVDLQKQQRLISPQEPDPLDSASTRPSRQLQSLESRLGRATSLSSVGVQRRGKIPGRLLMLPVGLLAIVLVLGVASWRLFYRSQLSFANGQRPMVLIGDFENRTGHPIFENSLRELFTSSLEQSPLMEVFPSSRVADVLRRMNQPVGKRIDESTGLEICQRENLLGFLSGSIVRLGSKFVLLVRLESPSGSDVAMIEKSAESEDQIPARIDEITDALRRKLGESTQSLRQNSVPLAKVTSSSLEAVRYYTLGKESLYGGDVNQSVLMFKKAVELDPKFAMAHEFLSVAYVHLRDFDRVNQEIRQAASLADRVSEPERLRIMGIYYLSLLDYKKACETYQVLMQLEPQDPVPYINLGFCEAQKFNFVDAVANTEKGLQFVPQSAVRLNLASQLLEQGNTAKAMEIAESFARDFPHDSPAQIVLGRAYLGSSRMEEARKVFQDMIRAGGDAEIEGNLYLADLAMTEGRYREGEATLKAATFAANKSKNPVAVIRAWSILAELLLGENAHAQSLRKLLADGAAPPDHPTVDFLLGRAYARTGQLDLANKYARMVDLLVQKDDVPALRSLQSMLSAEIALRQRNFNEAIQAAGQAVQYQNSVFAVETLARCYAAAGMDAEAAQQYETVLVRSNEFANDYRFEYFDAPAFRRAVEAHYRLGVLYRKLGRWYEARTHLRKFLSYWSRADETLGMYKDAQRLLRSLPATGTPTPAK